jgi:hypothetical protein
MTDPRAAASLPIAVLFLQDGLGISNVAVAQEICLRRRACLCQIRTNSLYKQDSLESGLP